MNTLMADLFAEGYGDTMSYDRDRVGITWATFGHLFSNTPGAAENYLKFLSAGGSLYPLDALKVAGVDMATPAAVEATFKVLDDMVTRLEQLVG
jgi:oligoendopeptidase F